MRFPATTTLLRELSARICGAPFVRLLLTICIALLLLQAAGAQQTSPIPPEYFGMHDYISRAKSTEPWPSISVNAVRLWDTYTEWSWLEPASNNGVVNTTTSHGHYDWSNLDWWIGLAQQHKVDVMYVFGMTPPWASSNPTDTNCHRGSRFAGGCWPPSDIAQGNLYWKEFVTAIVTRYKGRIKYYELWNEPNLSSGSSDPEWKGTPTELIQMGRDAADIIHTLDPDARVVSPGVTLYSSPTTCTTNPYCGPTYLQQYLSQGGTSFVDIVGFHSYFGTTPENITAVIRDYRTAMTNAGAGNKPLWDTEGSWCGSATCTFAAYPSNADAQAAFVARKYLLSWSSNVQRSYWYAWDSNSFGIFWDATNGIRVPGIAYQQVYNWMVGATMPSSCTKASDSTWTCLLTRPGYEALAIWNPSTPKSYIPNSRYTQVRDLAGIKSVIPAGGSVAIGVKPVLLETGDASTAPVATLIATPASGVAPLSVSATVSLSSSQRAISTSIIDFGDGTSVTARTSAHVYTSPGTYTIKATATDQLGLTTTASTTVVVTANQPPLARLSLSPASSGTAPVTVTASTSGSTDPDGRIASTTIDFGDGSPVVTSATASHTYSSGGIYTVKGTVTDDKGATSAATASVTVTAGNIAPTPRLTVTPTSGLAPLIVSADTSASSDADGYIASTTIDFGDGTVVAGSTANHTYASPGTYTIKAAVVDDRGLSSTATANVNVAAPNIMPIARLTVTPTTGVAPLVVSADLSASTDPDGMIVKQTIDFGDGTVVTGSVASHKYLQPGTFTITATVIDNAGALSTAHTTVIVTPKSPRKPRRSAASTLHPLRMIDAGVADISAT